MSFYDNKGQAFGQVFEVRFKIVPESYAFLYQMDLEIYRLAMKLRELKLGRSFEDCFQHARQIIAESVTNLTPKKNHHN
jgi:hypothetical protein